MSGSLAGPYGGSCLRRVTFQRGKVTKARPGAAAPRIPQGRRPCVVWKLSGRKPLPPRQVCTEFRCRPRIMQPREFGSRSVGLGANKGRNGCLRVRRWPSGKGTFGAAGAISFAGGWYAPPCHSEARYGPKNPYLNGRGGFFALLRMTRWLIKIPGCVDRGPSNNVRTRCGHFLHTFCGN